MSNSEELKHEESNVVNFQTIEFSDLTGKGLKHPYPIKSTKCIVGSYVILNNNPCKVYSHDVSKTGKHGSSKVNIVGFDVITHKKCQQVCPGHEMLDAFVPLKLEYQVTYIEGSDITALDVNNKENIFNLPNNELGKQLEKDFKENKTLIITVLYAPRYVSRRWVVNILVESYKEGKDNSS